MLSRMRGDRHGSPHEPTLAFGSAGLTLQARPRWLGGHLAFLAHMLRQAKLCRKNPVLIARESCPRIFQWHSCCGRRSVHTDMVGALNLLGCLSRADRL